MNTPGLQEEIYLIRKLAGELGIEPSEITGEWIDTFAIEYRTLWDSGMHHPEDIEEALYGTRDVQTAYSLMISKII